MNNLNTNQKFYFIKNDNFPTFDVPCFSYEELVREYKQYILKDDHIIEEIDDQVILERYFNDVYNMFLSKLTALAAGANVNQSEQDRMRVLLDELIKVKGILEREGCSHYEK